MMVPVIRLRKLRQAISSAAGIDEWFPKPNDRHLLLLAIVMTQFTLHPGQDAHAADEYAEARQRMVREIEANVRETREYLGKDVLDPRVIAAVGQVPRHEFVPEDLRAFAYLNQPLPIGHEQTISQPYMVAIMTDLLALPRAGRVLEVGTGSGYQAAVLAATGVEVYTIEIVEPLGRSARSTLARLGYRNVQVRIGDGFAGWPEAAPFDAIIVTAAADETPPPLLAQLKPGGRMIIPLENRFGQQDLVLIEKDAAGKVSREEILPVVFVPLTGER
jgi:protein-L-isoaspartate(D-aspartate) O-methyltransferase